MPTPGYWRVKALPAISSPEAYRPSTTWPSPSSTWQLSLTSMPGMVPKVRSVTFSM